MSRPYTSEQFADQLASDRNWRIKEIAELKSAINKADKTLQQVLLRALVAICYAHWEGFVRFSARKYLDFVAIRNMKLENLDRQFLRNVFLPRLGQSRMAQLSFAERGKLIDDILAASALHFSKMDETLVSTQSNLSFKIFSDICLVCGVKATSFADRQTFVDVVLLKRRNEIAHGEVTSIALEDLDDLADTTIELMRGFGNALENQIAQNAYLSPRTSRPTAVA